MSSKLGQAIETVLSLMPQEALVEDAKKHRFNMIHGAMGFASRDYAGERNWLVIDNENGRSMVLTGILYHQFNLEMSVFWWDSEAEKLGICKGKKTTWEGTEEEAMIAQNAIILKFFEVCEEEDNVMRRLEGKPTHQEERTRKKTLKERKEAIEKRIDELDAKHERLFQRKEDELSDPSADWKRTYVQLAETEKELATLEEEHWQIERELGE